MSNPRPPSESQLLRHKIHGLSALLSVLEQQLGTNIPLTRKHGVRSVDDLLIHIATLLTTGADSNLVVAISGSPASIFNMTLTVVTETADEDTGIHILHAQKQQSAGFAVCQASLGAFVKDARETRGLGADVIPQAQELFSILREDERTIIRWAVNHCSPRILARLKHCIRLDGALLEELERYKITPADRAMFNTLFPNGISLQSPELDVGALQIYLRRKGRPIRDVICVDDLEPLLNKVGSLPKELLNLVQKFIDKRKASSSEGPSESDLASQEFEWVYSVYVVLAHASKLLRRSGISDFLSRSRSLQSAPGSSSGPTQEEPGLGEESGELEEIPSSEAGPHTSQEITMPSLVSLCHSLDLVVSCYTSARILHRHAKRILSSKSNWTLVHIAPLRPSTLKPPQPVTHLEILGQVLSGGILSTDENWIKKLPRLEDKFTQRGAVHCEATLMALAANPSGGGEMGIEQVLQEMHPTIAVTKKSCYCCNLLGEILNDIGKGPFSLSGTHGVIVPWVPPANLDTDVLQRMANTLVAEVNRIVKKQRDADVQEALSRQSTPTSSDAGSPPRGEEYWEGDLRIPPDET
ncbi:hypothetical protein QCA50_019805 [Cerrena zonata]|uniref:Uncharacterized protein n=1 Tax=Cerrena zonata TaxID=2478898 RepID=A0AAW0FAH8_9APHY